MKTSHSVNKETFECKQCCIHFTQKRNLSSHTIKVHMPTEVLMCQFCNCTTKFDYNLKGHKIEQHEIEGKGRGIRGRLLYTCQRCNFLLPVNIKCIPTMSIPTALCNLIVLGRLIQLIIIHSFISV